MSQKDLSKTIPYGDLGIIPLESSKAIGKKVNSFYQLQKGFLHHRCRMPTFWVR